MGLCNKLNPSGTGTVKLCILIGSVDNYHFTTEPFKDPGPLKTPVA